MATINFAEVPLDNYVYIDGVAQKEIKIDGETVYKAPTRYYYTSGTITEDTKVEMGYTVFTGSSYTKAKTTDKGATSTHIDGGGTYPSGGMALDLREDEDYFLVMKNGSASQSPNGRTTLDIGDITLKFTRSYKAIEGWIWGTIGSFSGLNTLQMEVKFGNESVTFDFTEGNIDETIFLKPSTPSDTVTFRFTFAGSLTATRKFDGLNISVEDFTAYY